MDDDDPLEIHAFFCTRISATTFATDAQIHTNDFYTNLVNWKTQN